MHEAHISVKQYSERTSTPWQYYETTLVVDVDGFGVPVTFASVPARSVSEEDRAELGTLEGLAHVVGASPRDAVLLRSVGQATTAVALMIDPELRGDGPRKHHPVWEEFFLTQGEHFPTPPWWRHPYSRDRSAILTAEYLLLSARIPAEKSDLSGHTLATIIGSSGGTAVIAAVLAGAVTPWLLVAVPAGLIVMRVADGAGDALHDVVKHKILKRFAPELIDKKSDES